MRKLLPAWTWIGAAALGCCCATPAQVKTGDTASLEPGAATSDCRSALRVGLALCGAIQPPSFTGTPEQARQGRPISEAQVDAFLQQYGKPPREAVRALLDPTDENILAWLHARRRTLDNARFVAERMTALEPIAAATASAVAHGDAR
jgi:hypothetical protein